MPIIDPLLQFCLINKLPNATEDDKYTFFRKYLLKASINYINKDFRNLQSSKHFKEDFKESFKIINNKFECTIKNSDFKNISITNYYQFLYDHIFNKEKTEPNNNLTIKVEGKYYSCNDKFGTNFFLPSIQFSNMHRWLLTDSPMAILVVNFIKNLSDLEYHLLKLEVDLVEASGLTLVLCSNYSEGSLTQIINLIKDNQFSEVHLELIEKLNVQNFYKEYNEEYDQHLSKFQGFFYLYSNYLEKDSEYKTVYSKIKKLPHFKIINFSGKIESFIGNIEFSETTPFPYCSDGFNNKYLRVRLSNVPLYDDKEETIFTPSGVSGLGIGYINKKHFLKWRPERIKIIYENFNNNYHHETKYINFEDVHKVRPYLYTDDPLSLLNIDENMFNEVDKVQKKVNEIKNDNILQKFLNTLKNKFNVSAANYMDFMRSTNPNFSIYRTQIFSALEAYKMITTKKDEKERGFIYQVETGEGKSSIVALIAGALAKENKIVHVVSSNINLSNRDFMEKYGFFEQIGIASGVLLHENELPFPISDDKNNSTTTNNTNNNTNSDNSNKANSNTKGNSNNNNDINDKFNNNNDSNANENNEGHLDSTNADYLYIKNNMQSDNNKNFQCYSSKFYSEDSFKNTSNMNFSVCGYDYNNNRSIEGAQVIYSTLVNLECFYLKLIEKSPGSVDDYFKKSVLLIDEADSILIDEITNGTIVSRSMKSNQNKILQYVYDQQRKCAKESDTMNYINNNKSKFGENNPDLTIEDIKKMYEEIELVNSEEYHDGAKYVIKSFEAFKEKKSFFNEKRITKIAKFGIKFIGRVKTELIKSNKEDNNSEGDDYDNEEEENDIENQEQDQKITQKNNAKYIKVGKKDLKDQNKSKSELKNKGKGKITDQNVEKDNSEDQDEEKDKPEEKEEEDRKEEKDEKGNQKEKKKIIEKKVTYHYIVPFDFDHKGVVEPNKEFSGHIQQFIAIKEKQNPEYKNMIIKEKSMSYLYVSHPTFVNLYGSVCGFTGTIGDKADKKTYQDYYKLQTMKIPRHNPNQRVIYPIELCENYPEYYTKIVSEIIEFHHRKNPVLAIFQTRNDIDVVEFQLRELGYNYINIFKGENELITPEYVSGVEGSITLGTNVCGRGTNIHVGKYPLHVIVGFYSNNKRVIYQAYGRTARNGQQGTCRIICLKHQYLYPIDMYDERGIKEVIDKFKIRNQKQQEFIKMFDDRPWIFTQTIKDDMLDSISFTKEQIYKMRKAKVNVNRIVAYNYKFPIKMTVDDFLKIQAQKIYSLFNCPHSICTWRLFQRYVREMILESWSLKINEIDEEFERIEKLEAQSSAKLKRKNNLNSAYEKRINDEINNLNTKLSFYLPNAPRKNTKEIRGSKNESDNINGISRTFYHIFELVKRNHKGFNKNFDRIQNPVLYPVLSNNDLGPILKDAMDKNQKFFKKRIFSDINIDRQKIPKLYIHKEIGESKSTILNFGLRPFAIRSNSGARIGYTNFKDTNFIRDPELSYERRTVGNKITLLSITDKIDEIFNQICQKVSNLIGELTYLKLFFRRTICGGEFGICLTTNFVSSVNEEKDPYSIVDKDSIFLFTVNVKNPTPIIAGILVIFLVYIGSVVKKIANISNVICSASKTTIKLAKICLSTALGMLGDNITSKIFNEIIKFLNKILDNQLDLLSIKHRMMYNIIIIIRVLFESTPFGKAKDFCTDFIGNFFNNIGKISNKYLFQLQKSALNAVNSNLLTICALLLLNLAAFMTNFINTGNKLKYCEEEAEVFTEEPTKEKVTELEIKNTVELKPVLNDVDNYKMKKKTKNKKPATNNNNNNNNNENDNDIDSSNNSNSITNEKNKQ